MISKSKLGGIAVIGAIGLASPAFAQTQASAIGTGPVADPSSLHAFTFASATCYTAACNGGGSTGYNYSVAHDYRLKKHPHAHHAVHQ